LDTKLDIVGIGLIIVALITMLSFLSKEPGTLIRSWLRFIFQFFGWGGYAVPIPLAAVGVWLIWRHFGDQLPPVDPIRIVGVVVLSLGLLTLLQASAAAFQPIGPVYINPAQADPWADAKACPPRPQALLDQGWIVQNAHWGSYDIARCGHGGGYIGALIQVTLTELIGALPVFVLAIVALAGGGMMIARLTLKEALQLGAKGYERLRDRRSATAKPTAYKRTEKGEMVPVQKEGEADKEDKDVKAKEPDDKEPEPEKKEAKPAPVPSGRPSIVTGRGPAGTMPKPAAAPKAAATTTAGTATAAPPKPGEKAEAKAAPSAPPQPGGGAGQLTVPPRPGEKKEQAPARPGAPTPSGPPKPPAARPVGVPGARPPGAGGPPTGDVGRPEKADEGEADKAEKPGEKKAGSPPVPRPGAPPAGKQPSSRPGTGRMFGPSPPASIGGARPAPKPARPPAPAPKEDKGPLFDDLTGSSLDELQDAIDLEDEPPTDQMIKELVEDGKSASTSEEKEPEKKAGGEEPAQVNKEPAAKQAEAKTPGRKADHPVSSPSSDKTDGGKQSAAPAPAKGTAKPTPVKLPKADSKAPADEKPAWTLPSVDAMLELSVEKSMSDKELRRRAEIIEQTLSSFGAPGRVVEVNHGPVITQFGVEPDYIDGRAGKKIKVKVGKISALSDDMALALAAPTIRVEAPVPGKGYVGIEVPNAEPSIVGLRDVMDTPEFRKLKSPLRLALGQDVSGHPIVADLTSMPHLLIAGTTGSGKSVCVNGIICTMLMARRPDELKMIMIDPKRVELTNYNGIPHLMAPVVTELERIVGVLKWVQREMDDRYRRFAMAGARNITDYNSRVERELVEGDKLSYIMVIVDELADLMMLAPDETERVVTRLAQMARATGIHIIISTQRPSVDVVTGLIKANFPARIAFAVATGVDSRVILDMPGAEKLLGRGDMLFQAPDAPMPVRLQGVFVSDKEIQRIVDHWREQAAKMPTTEKTNFSLTRSGTSPLGTGTSSVNLSSPSVQKSLFPDNDGNGVDDLFDEAVALVRQMEKASISLLQRHLRIGYTRAARLIDIMEEQGVIGPHEGGSKPRLVLNADGEPLDDNPDDGDED
jgi:S-DNA-T family DNA segregation ATPase FtsK/SpoIIIE